MYFFFFFQITSLTSDAAIILNSPPEDQCSLVLSYPISIPDLACSDETSLTQLILAVQLIFLRQTVLVLGLQSGNAALYRCQLFFGIIQDTLGCC